MASGLLSDYLGVGLAAARPATPSLGTGVCGFYYATDTLTLSAWNGSAWANVSSGTTLSMPQDQIVFVPQFKVKSGCGGSIAIGTGTSAPFFLTGNQATPGNGDVAETAILLDAGTYDVTVQGTTDINRGKIDWSLDGASAFISAQDWYSGSTVEGAIKTGTLTVASAGRHLLDLTINGKNGSSSGYYFSIGYIKFVRQTLTVG